MKITQQAGKILYALLFLVAIPLGQWYWAIGLEETIQYDAMESRTAGSIIGGVGILLIAWGMFSLKKFGKGLPMNAYPPSVFVKQGPYRFLRHPIYWGYGMLMTGVSIFTGSAAGLWMVTPVSILGIVALVLGYEKIDMEKRFKGADTSVLLDIPSLKDVPISLFSRIVCLFWVISALAISNIIVFANTWSFTSSPAWAASPDLSFLKVNSAVIQIITWLFIFFVPLILKNKLILRRWTISMLLSIALSVYFGLLWPSVAAQYFYPLDSIFGPSAVQIFFTTPVFLILISALAYYRQFRKWRALFFVAAIIVSVFMLNDTNAFYLNAAVSAFIFFMAAGYTVIWSFIRSSTEKIANSWKEWIVGPVRIINHGIYVGLAAFLGILFCGMLVGSDYAWALLLFAVIVTVCAAIWAQVIEGSDKLKRPFGYYGALAGIALASFILWLMGYNVWVMIAIISVVMPWVQAIGRFRCLVNGCCHGKPTDNATIGIRFYHHRSRVCTISGLKGQYLHPTQVYSMLWLLVIGFLLLSFWLHQYSYSFIFGMYLILTGLGRFVEEAYRGEVQTPGWKGLRLYQWAAIVSVLAGIIFTVISVPQAVLQPANNWEIWAAAFAGGLFTFFMMGVDFPRSNARFSRLV